MLVALVSAKGSPGVTTTALALAAAAGQSAGSNGAEGGTLVVEVDPSGGDVEVLTGRWGEPGLPHVAAALGRGQVSAEALWSQAVEAPAGVRVVRAPADGRAAEATLVSCGEALGPVLAGLEGFVIVDAGRWSASQRSAGRIQGASVIGVVCHATPASAVHTRALVEDMKASVKSPVVAVVVGERPFRASEVQEVVGVPVAGVWPWDRDGVGALLARGAGWRWRWSLLGRTAPAVLAGLQAAAGEVVTHASR